MTSQSHVLVVDDDEDLRQLLAAQLREDGYLVSCAASGEEALVVLDGHPVDLVILDLGLQGIDGLDTCRLLRQSRKMPVLFLSARDDEADKVKALAVGGDDYLTKPYGRREMLARVAAMLRRYTAYPGAERNVLWIDRTVSIDLVQRIVRVDGAVVVLTPKEFNILALLASRQGVVFTVTQIIDAIWPDSDGVTSGNVMTHIANLRRKMEPSAPPYRVIKTVWGVGYKV